MKGGSKVPVAEKEIEKKPVEPVPDLEPLADELELSDDEDAALDALHHLSQSKPKQTIKVKPPKPTARKNSGGKSVAVMKKVKKTVVKAKAKGKSRKHHADRLRWERYIYRIFRSNFPHKVNAKDNVYMTGKVMGVMTNIVDDIIAMVMKQADELRSSQRRTTMMERDLKTAVNMIMPRELALHANSRATVALQRYNGAS